jgi:organic radical activating enzyme
MRETPTPDLTLTAAGGEPMTAEQAELLKRLAHEAYDTEAYGPALTRTEAARRIAALQAKIKLQGNPPHTQ